MELKTLIEKLSNPAKRAIQTLKLKKVEDLTKFTRNEIAELHGIGPNALSLIEAEMKSQKLHFKKPEGGSRSMAGEKFKTIDQYIASFPKEIREMLNEMRDLIRRSAPMAVEKISYNMPAFAYNGNLVYFAAFKKHLGFYPTASGTKKFENDLVPYHFSKGAIQFPLDKKLPKALITKIVKFRVLENAKKSK